MQFYPVLQIGNSLRSAGERAQIRVLTGAGKTLAVNAIVILTTQWSNVDEGSMRGPCASFIRSGDSETLTTVAGADLLSCLSCLFNTMEIATTMDARRTSEF